MKKRDALTDGTGAVTAAGDGEAGERPANRHIRETDKQTRR